MHALRNAATRAQVEMLGSAGEDGWMCECVYSVGRFRRCGRPSSSLSLFFYRLLDVFPSVPVI